METKYFWLQQKEKNQELKIEKIRGTVNPADLMTKHLDGKRLVTLCELLNIKRINGRPSSAPKLTIDTEYISRASRALAAMTLVKRASVNETAMQQGTWTSGCGMDWWIAASWILVSIVICCILMSLVLLRKKSGRVTDMVADVTQTLEEGWSDQTNPSRVLTTKNGKAAHCRNDCPFLLKSYSIQSLSWCSQCDPSDVLENALGGGALGHENKF